MQPPDAHQTARTGESSQFAKLVHKVRQLMEILNQLQAQNQELLGELENYRKDGNNSNNSLHLDKLDGLKSELRQLRAENKSLKEKEKLIKNKVERLAVKLNRIDM